MKRHSTLLVVLDFRHFCFLNSRVSYLRTIILTVSIHRTDTHLRPYRKLCLILPLTTHYSPTDQHVEDFACCDVTRRILVLIYVPGQPVVPIFGPKKKKGGTNRIPRNVGNKLPTCAVLTPRKSEDLIYTGAVNMKTRVYLVGHTMSSFVSINHTTSR